MLRQLARLTRPVEAAGDRALAIAVYADAADRSFAATDLGFEGVACVDDAARALALLCDLWKTTRLPQLRAWGEGLLDFVLYMQREDGRFHNFIVDWSGRYNERGPTSFAGGGFWHARGVRGLAKAVLAFGDERARSGLARGLAAVRDVADVPADVRAIHVLGCLDLLRDGDAPWLRSDCERWCDEIASRRRGHVLFDNPDQAEPHLWGHMQEGVLAEAGASLARSDLVEIACRSARAYLAPLIESGFDLPMVQPYGVASAAYGVERLAVVTAAADFARLARAARAWFDGRNTAGRPVYDRVAGRVHDGIDGGVLNEHSGAESNIVAAQTLLVRVARAAPSLMPVVDTCFPFDVRERLRSWPPAARSA